MYRVTRRFPDMSDFRLGPNPFEHIPVDWTIFATAADPLRDATLVAHGLSARIAWTGDRGTLPRGWQGVVRACHEHDRERECAVINEGCVWVEHSL